MDLNIFTTGCGGGLSVSVVAFYSDDPNSNPADVYSFLSIMLFEKRK